MRPLRSGGRNRAFLPFLFVLCAGCASWDLTASRRAYYRGAYDEAARLLEEHAVGEGRNRVLFLMERGMALRESGRYAEAGASFDEAARQIEDLWTRSVTGEVGRFLWNDTTVPFRGGIFERIYVHVEAMLCWHAAGDPEKAAVEARRVVLLFEDLETEETFPFVHYLCGLSLEAAGDLQGARFSYRAAQGARPDWDLPGRELARLEGGSVLGESKGLVFLILELGKGPVRTEGILPIPPSFKFVVPQYAARGTDIDRGVLIVGGEAVGRTERAADLAGIARRDLERRVLAEVTREVGRQVVTEVVARRIEDEHGDLAGLGFRILYFLVHTTDLRCWQTLPHEIQLLRVELPARGEGTPQPTEVHLIGPNGALLDRVAGPMLDIRPGRVQILHLRRTR